MTNSEEGKRWLKDAQSCCVAAEKIVSIGEYRAAVQNAQLCVEQSAKAVIACLAEPEWDHDPSEQLLDIANNYNDEILSTFGQGIISDLERLARDSEQIVPWHAWSTYGRKEENGSWTPAVDLCTEQIARWALKMSKKAFKTAERFVQGWLKE